MDEDDGDDEDVEEEEEDEEAWDWMKVGVKLCRRDSLLSTHWLQPLSLSLSLSLWHICDAFHSPQNKY